jgi:hypothetical protein
MCKILRTGTAWIRIRIHLKSWIRIRIHLKAGSGSAYTVSQCGSETLVIYLCFSHHQTLFIGIDLTLVMNILSQPGSVQKNLVLIFKKGPI